MRGSHTSSRLIPAMVPLGGETTWITTVALMADCFQVSIHRPVCQTPGLIHVMEWSAIDDAGVAYRRVGGGASFGEHGGQERCIPEFVPAPGPEAGLVRLEARFDAAPSLSAEVPLSRVEGIFPVTERLERAFATANNAPRKFISCSHVADPTGNHPVHIFGLELWSRETLVWAQWRSARGDRYLLKVGERSAGIGHTVHAMPRLTSVGCIALPVVVPENQESLEVGVRVRGNRSEDFVQIRLVDVMTR